LLNIVKGGEGERGKGVLGLVKAVVGVRGTTFEVTENWRRVGWLVVNGMVIQAFKEVGPRIKNGVSL
jgi:hypothetical protein